MKTKDLKSFGILIVIRGLCCVSPQALAQTITSLPVYNVVQSGARVTQAMNLASSLGIPSGMTSVSNGQVFFLDVTNFLAVPTTPVTDPGVISNLLAQTQNPCPSIPIRFEQIDFVALSNLVVLSPSAALLSASNALASTGLTPQFGTPVVRHTEFSAYYSNNNNVVTSSNQFLDTQVNYQFAVTNGYPLVGPGAQVQVTYGTNGNVTRLLYAARQLTAGLSVRASQPVAVLHKPIYSYSNTSPAALISYGCESPYDVTYASSRIGWQVGMGTPSAGGGSESFCWTGADSWPADFIKNGSYGTSALPPCIDRRADFPNWGVDTASIVINLAHG